MAKRKRKAAAAKPLPLNALVFIILAVFIVQAGMVMYYNNGNLTFTNKEAFYSLDRGAAIASGSIGKDIPMDKSINGYLYPLITSAVTKVLGPSNTIAVVYILDFAAFFFIIIFFYLITGVLLTGNLRMAATGIFATTAPVILNVLSGSDSTVVFLLFVMNLYYLLTDVEKRKVSKAYITAGIMGAVSFTGLIFAVASFVYVFIKMNRKLMKKHYEKIMWGAFGILALLFIAVLGYVFIENLSYEYLQKYGILNTKTFYVDTFFKDGFLWSKMFPPFFTVFFYIFFFAKFAEEIKNKATTHVTYFALLVLAAFLMEFISTLTGNPETVLFVSPFFTVVILVGISGVEEFAALIQGKKSEIFNKQNIVFGILVFLLIYNAIFFFNKTVEANGDIKYLSSSKHVTKFIER